MSSENLRHVLDGYKILDFTQFVAGPTVTLMMAENEVATALAFYHSPGPRWIATRRKLNFSAHKSQPVKDFLSV